MKNKIIMMICLALALSLCSCSKIDNPAVQEYTPGQGNTKGDVDAASFYEIDDRFEIGASKDGYAVFKDPDAAFKALVEKYSEGINLIRDEYHLLPLSKLTYSEYGTYGWQVTTGTEAERDQAMFVSGFFDIYENSFE